MNTFTDRLKIPVFLVALAATSVSSFGQTAAADSIAFETTPAAESLEIMMIPPLFEYVVAPDDLPDLQSRTDYIMDNFWNPFDFKNTRVVDQNALNHAFSVYAEAMPYASEKKVFDSVKKLIGKIKNNPGLSYQFVKAAEEALYGNRASFWADDIYVLFLDNLVSNKKIDDSKKTKYAAQLNLLKSNAVGETVPSYKFVQLDSKAADRYPDYQYTLIGFCRPECDDCRYTFLKLDISSVVNDLIEDGKLNVKIVTLAPDEKQALYSEGKFSPKWTVGYSDNATQNLDIRFDPSFYILDKNQKIVAKNLSVDNAILILQDLNTVQ